MTEQNGLERSATDRLRALLDERGVEWRKVGMDGTAWSEGAGAVRADEYERGLLLVERTMSPEQAIEATLGRETCEVEGSYEDQLYLQQVYQLSCGHEVMWEYTVAPDFCPWCGRRVVE